MKKTSVCGVLGHSTYSIFHKVIKHTRFPSISVSWLMIRAASDLFDLWLLPEDIFQDELLYSFVYSLYAFICWSKLMTLYLKLLVFSSLQPGSEKTIDFIKLSAFLIWQNKTIDTIRNFLMSFLLCRTGLTVRTESLHQRQRAWGKRIYERF